MTEHNTVCAQQGSLFFRSVVTERRPKNPETPPRILGKPKNHFFIVFLGHPLYPSKNYHAPAKSL